MGRYAADDWKAVEEGVRLGDSIGGCAESAGIERVRPASGFPVCIFDPHSTWRYPPSRLAGMMAA